MFRVVFGQNAAAGSHRFEEGRMGTTHFSRLDIQVRMRPQLQAAISVYRSGKLHPGVGHRLQSPDITRCIRGVANDEEWHRGLYPPVSFDNKVGVVLWFQSAHVEEECPAFEAESFYEFRTLLSAAIRYSA